MELVVGASQATMKSILGKLSDLLAREYALVRGVRGDIQYINDELASMQAFLVNLAASGTNDHDAQTKDWMKQIRDVAYDVEDCMDDFIRRLPNDPQGGGCLAEIRLRIHELWTCAPRRDIAVEIADLKYRAQQIGKRRIRYGVKDPKPCGSNTAGRAIGFNIAEDQLPTTQLVGIKEPVGMDKNGELGKWVTNGGERGVLSISGFGGVGKTTIARALYHKYSDQFDCRAMVTVSQGSDLVAILKSIFNQVKPQGNSEESKLQNSGDGGNNAQGNPEEMNLMATFKYSFFQLIPCAGRSEQHGRKSERDKLVSELQKHLDKKRYCLLIDDVWSAKTWQGIWKHLPPGMNGSKIIVTTRFQAVAAACYQNKETNMVYPVEALNETDAAKLFKDIVSESKSSEDGQMESVEKLNNRILKMCGGLPLAIVTMAGHRACNPQKPGDKWNYVFNSLFPETSDIDSGNHMANILGPEGVTKILDYCYNDLPADLRTCSLYLSVFPKGLEISRKRLTRRWVAEGFVIEKEGLGEEDVAEAYFNHLIKRKIIRPVEHSSNGKVKTCQVHDMVLEYMVSKSSEENFTTVIGGHWLMPMHSSKVRRLSLQCIDSKHTKVEKMNLSHLRSLSLFGSLDTLPSHSLKIGLVQVLDLEGCTDFKEKHFKEISKMPLLKYLSLRRVDIDKIPPYIDKLQYLETLDIRETKVEQLPRSVGQLNRISNILGGNKVTRKALKLPGEIETETMRTLRILSGIRIDEGSKILKELHHFTGLKKLVIYKLKIDKENYDDLLSAIQYLGGYSLQSLTIDNESIIDECSGLLDHWVLDKLDSIPVPPRYLHALELSGLFLRIPKWIGNLNDLKKLTLSMIALRTNTLELLKNLPCLFSLTFSLTAGKHQVDLVPIIEKNKTDSDGIIVVQKDWFQSLKLLRFSSPLVPLLSFSENAMPKLERLELRFRVLEGLFGMDNLKSLKEVHLRVSDKAGKTTKLLVDDLISASRKIVKPSIIRNEYCDL